MRIVQYLCISLCSFPQYARIMHLSDARARICALQVPAGVGSVKCQGEYGKLRDLKERMKTIHNATAFQSKTEVERK